MERYDNAFAELKSRQKARSFPSLRWATTARSSR